MSAKIRTEDIRKNHILY